MDTTAAQSHPDDPKAAFEALEDAFRARDMEALAARWADGITHASPGGAIAGKAARMVAERVWLDAFPDAVIEERHRHVTADTVILEGVMSGTHAGPLLMPQGALPPTGRHVSGPYCSVMRFAGGQVADQRVYYDALALMRQLTAPAEAEGSDGTTTVVPERKVA